LYCTIEANTDRHEVLRALSAIAELLVSFGAVAVRYDTLPCVCIGMPFTKRIVMASYREAL